MDTSNKNKSKNPLYVVRNNGVDVESANGLIDMLLKKTGLDTILPILESVLEMILSQVQTYQVFIEVKKMFDLMFEKLIELIFQIQQLTSKSKI
jgi:hypothetical protein